MVDMSGHKKTVPLPQILQNPNSIRLERLSGETILARKHACWTKTGVPFLSLTSATERQTR
jgi:hypothetical protein